VNALERKRRLLLVSHLPPPYGGLAVHTQRLQAEATRRGWHVSVPLRPREPEPPPGFLRRTRLLVAELGYLGRVLVTPADVIHDHLSTYAIGVRSPAALALQIALLVVLRMKRRPWIVSCGNGLVPGALARTGPRLRRLYRWLYASVRAGIAKNDPILDVFRELGLGDRSRVVGTFLDPGRSGTSRPLGREIEAFLAAHPQCVVTAGFRFEPLYHLEAVVRAVAAVRAARPGGSPELGLVVLGSHAEDPIGKADYDAALRETGLAPHVLLLRDVDDALTVIARGSVFVRATDVDGDANTVKEAMMVGTPVLATDLPNRPPGIERFALSELHTLGARLRPLLEERDPIRIERNRAFVSEDIARNTAAIFALYDEALR
jgi:glycosyltransferase involved in cell wall biosynthesis